jgi:hypothetical protein
MPAFEVFDLNCAYSATTSACPLRLMLRNLLKRRGHRGISQSAADAYWSLWLTGD